jgi:hypothetical protein
MFSLGSCFSSGVGNTIETDLTGLISGAASLAYDLSILSAFGDRSFWPFVSTITFSDESGTVSVEEISRETSALAGGTPRGTSALA